MMKFTLISLLFIGYVWGQSDICDGQNDGHVPEWGCDSFTMCVAGDPVIIDCEAKGQVYNPDTQRCDDPQNVPPPCGLEKNCTNREDGRYADWLEDCEYYFTCLAGNFLGSNPCAPGTVFDEVLCICNFPFDVYEPCGTKPHDGNEPTERGCPLDGGGSGEESNLIF